jgi:hypothetical protein
MYLPYTLTECVPCVTQTVSTCDSPCGAPGFPFPPLVNEPFVGYSARPYIDPTGIPVFKYNFTNFLSHCCGGSFTFRSGAQVVTIPADQLLGQFSFPLALLDGAVVNVEYTDCDGFLNIYAAYRAYLTDGCKVTPFPLSRKVEHWTLSSCSLCPCDCSIPANIEVDFGQGFVKIASLEHDGGIYPVPAYGFKASGKTILGTMSLTRSECIGATSVSLYISPGLPANTPVRIVFFPTGTPQIYNFKPLGCDSPADIVNICLPCNGGGSPAPCPTITAIYPAVYTPAQTGCGGVVSIDPAVVLCIEEMCAARLVQIDVPFMILTSDWQPFGGGFRALITHNRGYTGSPVPLHHQNLSNGDEFAETGDAPNDGNSYYILAGAVPPLTINGISEYIQQ